MSLDFGDFLDYCRAEALASKFEPTEDSIFRSLCREYSKKFHTPLHVVYTLDPVDVIVNIYEDQLGDIDLDDLESLESLLDVLYSLADPNYTAEKKKEFDDFAKQAELEEEERLALGKPIHPALKDENSLSRLGNEENKKPTSGGIDLSYLENEEQ